MEIINKPERNEWAKLLQRPTRKHKKISKIVAPILKKVKRNGDKALLKFALEFDLVHIDEVVVSQEAIELAANEIPDELKEAIKLARKNIGKFHEAQVYLLSPCNF